MPEVKLETIPCMETAVFQCQNCRCIPDYCPQTVPRPLCPCDGIQTPCSRRTTAEMQTVVASAMNVFQHQQQSQLMIPRIPAMKYFLIQQPSQTIPMQVPGQITIGSQQQQQQQQQQQITQTLTSLPQQISSQQISGIEQPSMSPVYVIRTIEQPGQVLREVHQIPDPVISSQYLPAIPIQQMVLVPSMQQQIIPQTQSLTSPLQIPIQTVTLQVPVTMVEHCTPRINACPLGLPSIHAVTECDNITDTSATRCITAEEARKLYTCLPHFNFNKLWDI
uniref:EB domain-containing protein n=1 Tax=Elaeophora elaphi TaxID=1147741 RepID=A0A0R3RSP2_9BILA